MPKNSKDFNIFFSKVTTANQIKDIAVVTGYNKIVQQIEQACLTQKGELMADPNFGSNYYSFKFSMGISLPALNSNIRNVIKYAIPTLYDVTVNTTEYTDEILKFDVTFTTNDTIKKQTMTCTLEVPLI
jgi:hypothetical protein